MFKKMKLKSINDIDNLPSVLDVEELSQYLIDLVVVIRDTNADPITGAESINNLISYQGCNEQGLSIEASKKIFAYIKETYDPSNTESVDWNTANLANLTCIEAKEFIIKRLSNSSSKYEKQELTGALNEIEIKT